MILDYEYLENSFAREKDKDKVLVLKYAFQYETFTRKDLIRDLSLRPSTVSRVISEFEEDRILKQCSSKTRSGRGRPEISLEINGDRFWSISFSIMSRSLLGAVFNFKGACVKQITTKLDTDITSEGMIEVLNQVTGILSAGMPTKKDFLGFGIALPGLHDRETKSWRKVSRFPKMRNLDFRVFERKHGGILLIERNIDSLLKYALIEQPELANGTTLLVHWGHGIAASCSIEGEIIHAPKGLFGEIGHWDMDSQNSGSGGNLESVAGLSGILKKFEWNEDLDEYAIERIIADGVFPKKELSHIRNIIQNTVKNLYLTFFPNNILFLSPFVDTEIAHNLEMALQKELPDFIDPIPEVRALDYNNHGEAIGIANSVFSASLKDYLRARW